MTFGRFAAPRAARMHCNSICVITSVKCKSECWWGAQKLDRRFSANAIEFKVKDEYLENCFIMKKFPRKKVRVDTNF